MRIASGLVAAGAPVKASLVAGAVFWAMIGAMAHAAPLEEPQELSKCQSCHGPDGNATSPDVPRLNGQQPKYLANRIRSFADPTRQNVHAIQFMWNVNSHLSDAAVVALAGYFSAQSPTAASPKGRLAEEGRKIFDSGGPQLPACQGCHGVGGEGTGLAPRLAGQHSRYLRLQMESFSLRSRVDETMNSHTRMLTPDQITALVVYLAKD